MSCSTVEVPAYAKFFPKKALDFINGDLKDLTIVVKDIPPACSHMETFWKMQTEMAFNITSKTMVEQNIEELSRIRVMYERWNAHRNFWHAHSSDSIRSVRGYRSNFKKWIENGRSTPCPACLFKIDDLRRLCLSMYATFEIMRFEYKDGDTTMEMRQLYVNRQSAFSCVYDMFKEVFGKDTCHAYTQKARMELSLWPYDNQNESYTPPPCWDPSNFADRRKKEEKGRHERNMVKIEEKLFSQYPDASESAKKKATNWIKMYSINSDTKYRAKAEKILQKSHAEKSCRKVMQKSHAEKS